MPEMIGAIVQIILGYMQFSISQPQQTPALCFTIALIALTAARPPPSSRALKICNFHLILGSAVIISSAVPNALRWLPYLSCICPLFHLLPFPFQLQILHFSWSIWVAIKCYVCSLFDMLLDRFRLQSVWNGQMLSPPYQQRPTSTWRRVIEMVHIPKKIRSPSNLRNRAFV